MNHVFHNLKNLRNDMIKNGWIIDSFTFKYKNINYVALVHLPQKNEKVPKYALVRLEFINMEDISQKLEVYANVVRLLIDAKTLREFFGIQYSNNLGDILTQFNHHLAKFIPTQVSTNKSKDEKEQIINSLSVNDSEDPNKVYCFGVKRNPLKKNGQPARRTPFNDNKTKYLRPRLYNLLGKDKTLSFLYSSDPSKERSTEDIIKSWSEKRY